MTDLIATCALWTIIVLIILIELAGVAASVICAAKGKWITAAAGPWLVIYGIPFVAACRPARPDSWWARRRYDETMRHLAGTRWQPRARWRWRLEITAAALLLLALACATSAAP